MMILILLKILLWINFGIFLAGVLFFLSAGRKKIKKMNDYNFRETDKLVTTIIPIKYGTNKSLENLSEVLNSQPNKNCKVIVAIENSSEIIFQGLKQLESKYSNFKIVISGEPNNRMGKSHNMYEAYKFVETEYVAFKDDDVKITRNNYLDLLKKLERPGTGGGFAPAFYNTDYRHDKLIEIITNYNFSEGLIIYEKLIDFNFCAGAFMMFRKEAIDKSGGIVKILNNIADDASLGKMLYSNNYKIELSNIPVFMESKFINVKTTIQHIKKWMVIVKKILGIKYYFFPIVFQLSNLFWITLVMTTFYSESLIYLLLPSLVIIYKIITSLYLDKKVLEKRYNFFHYISVVLLGIFQIFAWIISLFPNRLIWAGKLYKIGKGGKIFSIMSIKNL